MTDPIRLLAVEDDPVVQDLLRDGLSALGFIVRVTDNGTDALSEAGGAHDLILLDVELPDISGFEVARRLRATGNPILIIMTTALNAEADVVAGLEAGADGYVTKPFSLKELSARITALVRRQELFGAAPLTFGDITLDEARRTADRKGCRLRLTETEFRLLAYFLRNPGRDVSRETLLREVWRIDFDPGTAVVDTHLSNLRKKLRALGPPVIQTVRGLGFRLESGE